mmetsp:Transcript_21192/g.42060  ORF Transcript_21192/g.42060 Transcript_21192/m.42060 type:complete len:592 (+) Transcript_21192:83-1858(+)|eukprot:CAMPEP_0175140944 /NCGR_PEP_ID=MMETSP0087-20121206/11804_1 /TAXON_ID=136419 /ORGANISM="Unknown Unknown, Strain D1" /LENGTH=591 /DNA_ID=CAMNT_0016424251 /DNA_START=86 /DNA_END=1861 /DNA_ORIENTATION=+
MKFAFGGSKGPVRKKVSRINSFTSLGAADDSEAVSKKQKKEGDGATEKKRTPKPSSKYVPSFLKEQISAAAVTEQAAAVQPPPQPVLIPGMPAFNPAAAVAAPLLPRPSPTPAATSFKALIKPTQFSGLSSVQAMQAQHEATVAAQKAAAAVQAKLQAEAAAAAVAAQQKAAEVQQALQQQQNLLRTNAMALNPALGIPSGPTSFVSDLAKAKALAKAAVATAAGINLEVENKKDEEAPKLESEDEWVDADVDDGELDEIGKMDVEKYSPAFSGCRSVSRYQRLNEISRGTYGTVYRGKDKVSGDIVALKRIKTSSGWSSFPNTCLREINILTCIRHPNIIRMKEVVVGRKPENVYLVMEYMDTDLSGLLDSMSRSFTIAETKCIMKQLLKATAALHKVCIMHRDFKTANLLYSKGKLKICDFGEACRYTDPPQDRTPVVMAVRYRAPEILLGSGSYSRAVDMWGIGCIFAELLTSTHLIAGEGELDQIQKMFELLGTPMDEEWPGYSEFPAVKKASLKETYPGRLREKFCKGAPVNLSDCGFDLLTKLLAYNPEKRISAAQALKHPFFAEPPVALHYSDMPQGAADVKTP